MELGGGGGGGDTRRSNDSRQRRAASISSSGRGRDVLLFVAIDDTLEGQHSVSLVREVFLATLSHQPHGI